MNSTTCLLIGFAIGGVVFLVIGWLLGTRRSPAPSSSDHRLESELRQQLSQRNTELEKTLQAAKALQDQLTNLRIREGKLETDAKSLNDRLTTERQQLQELQEKLRKEFEAVANRLLLENTSRFNQQSRESLDAFLKPLKEKLNDFKTSLDETRKETVSHSALLKDQISRIGTEAANLSKALKGDVKVLGNWGENMLDEILEKSGLQRGIHFRRQKGARDAEGDQRYLDVVIELPEQRNLVVDSKVSLRSYEQYVNASDEAVRFSHLDNHVEALRNHFRSLGNKRYQDLHGINAPDFVLMYVPIEAAFFAALAREPGLFSEALDRNVVLITNSTLLATLRTVAHVWRLADQQKHALEIADRGGRLYDKFVGFIEDMKTIGKSLDEAKRVWESAHNKLHSGAGNLVRQVEQLKDLGAKAAKSLPQDVVEKAEEFTGPGTQLRSVDEQHTA